MTYSPNVLKEENAKTYCNIFIPWTTTAQYTGKNVDT